MMETLSKSDWHISTAKDVADQGPQHHATRLSQSFSETETQSVLAQSGMNGY
jgi:hypothetical protein